MRREQSVRPTDPPLLNSMTLILEIAAGILLGFGLLKLPTIYRRWKMKRIYSHLDLAGVFQHFDRTDSYTEVQRSLLLKLAVTQSPEERKEVASQLVSTFPDK
jgi:hypothetical protein